MKYLLVNFKTNKTMKQLEEYFNKYTNFSATNRITKQPVFFLNSLYSLNVKKIFPNLLIGNQGASEYGYGSFTSSVCFEQLKAECINWVLLGHSEQFKYFHLQENELKNQIQKALALELNAVCCFGNESEIDDENELVNFLFSQIKSFLPNEFKLNKQELILAYEPIYAIGSGKSANPDFINNVISHLKIKIVNEFKCNLPILYGGSVNTNNIASFIKQKSIDGVLIGKEALTIKKMEEMVLVNEKE